ncbi:hypothetical protein JX265_004410 [Neoarthrinium moseri]|uniref:Beta-lactamase-related domain-containing protein n=1 Tax=Neoarthrinium moseri TaxID=1658444 RepID=A0A9Q0ASW4_9PEZI|nr:uncharacterized protein JN550_001799 [Neoarthrinium moseri]KAI1875352.1 hypothetical protein JX265_004410 [Neoarthrinium moseri]KAI1875513.1 hypothetical protein JN550_001799 [Neoarthrinium moseri]
MEGVETLMNKAVQDGTILGAVLLAKDKSGNVNYYNAFGSRTVVPEEKPMEKDTIFLMASMTKLMTTIAALQVVERGLIKLDDDVTGLLPVLAKQEVLTGFSEDGKPTVEKRRKPITLRQLLTHSFGGAYDFLSPDIVKYREYHKIPEGPRTTIDEAFGTPLLHQPGEGWLYGPGLDWAGQVVEKLTGTTLEEHMQQNIWGPLGLRDITFWPEARADMQPRRAAMAIRDAATGKAVQSRKPINISAGLTQAAGGQGAFAGLADYLEILRSLLVDDGRLLRRATTEAMFRPQLSPAAKAALLANFKHPEWAVGHFPDTEEYDWGLGGILIDGDKHPFRKRNAMLWSGNANLSWFLDRTAGVCGVFGTQLLPPADPQIEELIKAFEEGVYSLSGAKTKL